MLEKKNIYGAMREPSLWERARMNFNILKRTWMWVPLIIGWALGAGFCLLVIALASLVLAHGVPVAPGDANSIYVNPKENGYHAHPHPKPEYKKQEQPRWCHGYQVRYSNAVRNGFDEQAANILHVATYRGCRAPHTVVDAPAIPSRARASSVLLSQKGHGPIYSA